MKHLLFIILTSLILSSCEKDFNTPLSGTKMSISSFFSDTSVVTVVVSKSYPLANNNTAGISDASIELYEDSVFKEILHHVSSGSTSGTYKSNLIPQRGRNYSITVTEPVYGKATAQDNIPLPATINSCQLLQYVDSGNYGIATVDLNFTDNPSVPNYYSISMTEKAVSFYLDTAGDTILYTHNFFVHPSALTKLQDSVFDYSSDAILFSDNGFNGQQKQVILNCDAYTNTSNILHATLYINLNTISKSYYEYFRTLALLANTNQSATYTSVNIYGNIQNGYGIFAGQSAQSVQVHIK